LRSPLVDVHGAVHGREEPSRAVGFRFIDRIDDQHGAAAPDRLGIAPRVTLRFVGAEQVGEEPADAVEEAVRLVRGAGCAVGGVTPGVVSRLQMNHVAAEAGLDQAFECALGVLPDRRRLR
jgi:hypothetical protein